VAGGDESRRRTVVVAVIVVALVVVVGAIVWSRHGGSSHSADSTPSTSGTAPKSTTGTGSAGGTRTTATTGPASSVVATTTIAPTTTGGPPVSTPQQLCPDAQTCAQSLEAAWQRGDHATAVAIAGASLAQSLFATVYRASDGWAFQGCQGAAGSSYCTWHAASAELIIRVQNAPPPVVISVQFCPPGQVAC
jgi:hypothetical protein